MEKLKPCPFCGLKNTVELLLDEDYPGQYTVYCNFKNGGCGGSAGFDKSADVAIEKWNRRFHEEAV